MSILVDSSPLIADSIIVSQYYGLGVPGADVPQTPTGGDTGSMMNESVTRPDDNAVEFRFEIASGPTGGASFTTLNEDGSYALTVPSDGTYTWTFNLWRDGTADAGNPFTGTARVGAAADSISAATTAAAAFAAIAAAAGGISAASTPGDSDTSFAQAIAAVTAAATHGDTFTGLVSSPGALTGLLQASSTSAATFQASVAANAGLVAGVTVTDVDVANVAAVAALVAGLIANEAWAAAVVDSANQLATITADSANAAAFIAAVASVASITETSTPGATFAYQQEIAFLVATIDLRPIIDAAVAVVPAIDGNITIN